MFNIFIKSKNIEILSFHGINSSINSKLEQNLKSTISNILKNKNKNNLKFNYSQNLLYGHAPNQTQMTPDTTFLKMINKSILDLSLFNEKKAKKKILVASSTGAYLVLNWLQQNPKNKIDLILLFKPVIDVEYSLQFFIKANPNLANQINFDEFKLSNKKIWGSKKLPFKLNPKNKILLFCGKKDNIVGNKYFMEKRIFGNINFFESENSRHNFQTEKEYLEFENLIKNNL